jgi:hypothetical protein
LHYRIAAVPAPPGRTPTARSLAALPRIAGTAPVEDAVGSTDSVAWVRTGT